MNEIQKELLMSYLRNDDIDILSVAFLKGGNISNDSLTVHYYERKNGEWYLTTDTVEPNGTMATRSARAMR